MKCWRTFRDELPERNRWVWLWDAMFEEAVEVWLDWPPEETDGDYTCWAYSDEVPGARTN